MFLSGRLSSTRKEQVEIAIGSAAEEGKLRLPRRYSAVYPSQMDARRARLRCQIGLSKVVLLLQHGLLNGNPHQTPSRSKMPHLQIRSPSVIILIC